MAGCEADRRQGGVGSVWGGLQRRVLPVLLRFQTHAGRHPLHADQQRCGSGGVASLQLLFAALAGQYWPEVS
jgi:hypothetical protein